MTHLSGLKKIHFHFTFFISSNRNNIHIGNWSFYVVIFAIEKNFTFNYFFFFCHYKKSRKNNRLPLMKVKTYLTNI